MTCKTPCADRGKEEAEHSCSQKRPAITLHSDGEAQSTRARGGSGRTEMNRLHQGWVAKENAPDATAQRCDCSGWVSARCRCVVSGTAETKEPCSKKERDLQQRCATCACAGCDESVSCLLWNRAQGPTGIGSAELSLALSPPYAPALRLQVSSAAPELFFSTIRTLICKVDQTP